jgi:hypothetical protein
MDFGPTQSLADAWQQLLDSYMPFLSEAAGQAAQSLLLYQPGGGWDASGQRSEQVGGSLAACLVVGCCCVWLDAATGTSAQIGYNVL